MEPVYMAQRSTGARTETALRVVRFRERYFVYKHPKTKNGAPKVLGRTIVDRIPNDRDRYEKWLQRERACYEQYTALLDSRSLARTQLQLMEILDLEQTSERRSDLSMPSWKRFNRQLHQLPSSFCTITTDTGDGWTYIVDLDRELFILNKFIYFNLREISGNSWRRALKYDDAGLLYFHLDTCPEAHDTISSLVNLNSHSQLETMNLTGRQYHATETLAPKHVDLTTRFSAAEIISLHVFETFIELLKLRNTETFAGWGPEEFAFKETAFAIVSMAAGKFHFDSPDRFCGYTVREKCEGYLIDRQYEKKPTMMPLFGSGCYMDQQEAGSAPPHSIYRFANVTIKLVPDSLLDNNLHLMTRQAIELDTTDDRDCVSLVLFSIHRYVLAKVSVKDGVTHVQHTGVISMLDERCTMPHYLWPPWYKHDPIPEDDQDKFTSDLTGYIRQSYQGFIVLQEFLVSATQDKLAKSTQGIFPPEIYAKIIPYVDVNTRKACAEASLILYNLSRDYFSFDHSITILDYQFGRPSHIGPSNDKWQGINKNDTFSVRFDDTGRIERRSLQVPEPKEFFRREMKIWCPVIGESDRPSMILQAKLRTTPDLKRTEFDRYDHMKT